MSKLDDSIKAQKDQLSALIISRDSLKASLKATKETIAQLNGSINALEFAKKLELEAQPPLQADQPV